MRKGFLILLAAALVAAMVAPAVAGTDINGYYRAKEWVSNFHTNGTPVLAKDAPTNAYVEQRLRLRFASGEENVKAVAFFELDFSAWGDQAGTQPAGLGGSGAVRNTGGAFGGDRINLETKNVYVWFKVPNTPVDFTVGLQTQTDAYAGLLYGGADMAGVFMNGKFEPVTVTLGMAKLYENDSAKWDDMSLYVGSVKFSPTKVVKLGLNFYFLQDDTEKLAANAPAGTGGALATGAVWNLLPAGPNKKKIFFPGIDVAVNAGPVTLSGFFVYNFGKIEYTTPGGPEIDINGFAADARIDLNAGPGKLFVEGLYISGGDNVAREVESIVTFSDFDASPGGNSAFSRTGMSILLNNADAINTSMSLVGSRTVVAAGSTSPALGGRGLIHAATGFSMKVGPRLSTAVGAGYLRANKRMLVLDNNKKGKELGIELNANVSYNIMKGLDFGVYGAYAWLGDYFESTTAGVPDPDNAWSGNLRLNYAF